MHAKQRIQGPSPSLDRAYANFNSLPGETPQPFPVEQEARRSCLLP